jgi:hypothetical protein
MSSELQAKHMSITEMEIFHGLIGRMEKNFGHQRAFVYFRQDAEFMGKVDPDKRWLFEFEYVTEEERKAKEVAQEAPEQFTVRADAADVQKGYRYVDSCIRDLAARPGSVVKVCDYTPTSVNRKLTRITGMRADGKRFGVGYVNVPDSFGDRIFVDLFHAITKQFPQPTRRMNLMHLEDVFHRNMLLSSTDCFGRDEMLADLHDKITNSNKIITVLGKPGAGKTTVMSGQASSAAQRSVGSFRRFNPMRPE